ncbi:MAG: hypothetical protein SF187_19730 [Deltaproteobacteria bacterium]|nr:hypothetical protein [Deltaproteobacteria bacterium]
MHPRFILTRRAQWLLGGVLFCFFMLTGSRERPWSDATPMFEVAEALVNRGEFNIATPWPVDLHPGRGGKTFAIAPLLQSLQHVPGVLVRHGLMKIWPGTNELSLPFAAHIGPAALAAFAVVTFILLCQWLGLGLGVSLCSGLVLATCTMLWVYARSPYAEALQTACFTAFLLQTAKVAEKPTRRGAVVLGITAGLLVDAKTVLALATLGAAAFLVATHWRRWPVLKTLVLWGLLGFVPVCALIPFYNWARWGSPWHEGYDFTIPVFEERLPLGLWGLFLSPGKSLLLYCPPLVLSLFALPRFWRRHKRMACLLLLLAGPVVLLYGKMLYWSGDYAWGPRYLTFAVPVFMLPAAVWLDDLWSARATAQRWWARTRLLLFVGVCATGLVVTLLGAAFYWDHYIRITQDARDAWLGVPDRSGAPTPTVDGLCGACFEDVHQLQWLPAFVPVEGHYWMLKHAIRGDDWQVAAHDAPWSRYTRKPLDIERSYARVRFDWWPIEFWQQARGGMGVVLCLWFVFGLFTCSWLLWPQIKTAGTGPLPEPTVR